MFATYLSLTAPFLQRRSSCSNVLRKYSSPLHTFQTNATFISLVFGALFRDHTKPRSLLLAYTLHTAPTQAAILDCLELNSTGSWKRDVTL